MYTICEDTHELFVDAHNVFAAGEHGPLEVRPHRFLALNAVIRARSDRLFASAGRLTNWYYHGHAGQLTVSLQEVVEKHTPFAVNPQHSVSSKKSNHVNSLHILGAVSQKWASQAVPPKAGEVVCSFALTCKWMLKPTGSLSALLVLTWGKGDMNKLKVFFFFFFFNADVSDSCALPEFCNLLIGLQSPPKGIFVHDLLLNQWFSGVWTLGTTILTLLMSIPNSIIF